MRRLVFLCDGLGLFTLATMSLFAQARSVAITVDDLPYTGGAPGAEFANKNLLTAFHAHGVPVTGFVIQRGVEGLGVAAGTQILREWTGGEFDLGNHTYSHPYREQP